MSTNIERGIKMDQVRNIGKMNLKNLPKTEKEYLCDLPKLATDMVNPIPVYYRDENGDVFFIDDYTLCSIKEFEKTAPASLYRGGALLSLVTDQGQVVIPDEHDDCLRLIGGIAHFDEGDNLIKTAIREAVVEELAVLSKDEKTRFVPRGTDGVSLSINGWGFSAQKLKEIGEIKVLKHFFNDVNHAFEVVVQWTILGELEILHIEDCFKGGMSGISPFIVDKQGRIIGIYSGRQGLIQIPVSTEIMKLHPTLQKILQEKLEI